MIYDDMFILSVVVSGVALWSLMKLIGYYLDRNDREDDEAVVGGAFRANWKITDQPARKGCAYCGATPCGCGAESGRSAWVGTSNPF